MKKETVQIETPEKILFTYTIADTGQRIVAYLIDFLSQVLFVVILYFVLGYIFRSLSLADMFDEAEQLKYLFWAFLYLVYFFIQWGYFIFFEALFDGQSPGKMAVKIRVIKVNGDFMDFSTIVVRNLLRAIDSFPFLHFLGGAISLVDIRSRRLGDFAAGTVVVDDVRFNCSEPNFYTRLSEGSVPLPRGDYINRLNEEELFIIRRFLNEKEKMPKETRQKVAENLAGEVKQRIVYEKKIGKPLLFLEGVYKAHTYADKK